MRYRLERSTKGQITQCENKADGGNVYAKRKEINDLAIKNLARPTPGKLGGLSNIQLYNFNISAFSSDTSTDKVIEVYNSTSTFPANATQTIMFGVDGLNNKAQYFNIKSMFANIYSGGTGAVKLRQDAYVSFYLLQNSSGTSSLGTKIPYRSPLYGNGGGAVTFSTTGNINGAQSVVVKFAGDSVTVPESEGVRCSGLALKTIYMSFEDTEDATGIEIDVGVYVDVSSQSQTY